MSDKTDEKLTALIVLLRQKGVLSENEIDDLYSNTDWIAPYNPYGGQ